MSRGSVFHRTRCMCDCRIASVRLRGSTEDAARRSFSRHYHSRPVPNCTGRWRYRCLAAVRQDRLRAVRGLPAGLAPRSRCVRFPGPFVPSNLESIWRLFFPLTLFSYLLFFLHYFSQISIFSASFIIIFPFPFLFLFGAVHPSSAKNFRGALSGTPASPGRARRPNSLWCIPFAGLRSSAVWAFVNISHLHHHCRIV